MDQDESNQSRPFKSGCDEDGEDLNELGTSTKKELDLTTTTGESGGMEATCGGGQTGYFRCVVLRSREQIYRQWTSCSDLLQMQRHPTNKTTKIQGFILGFASLDSLAAGTNFQP
jgi:hypothetical protein